MFLFRRLAQHDAQAVISLFAQLTQKPIAFDVVACMQDPNLHAFVLLEDGVIVAFGAIVFYRTPTKGKVATIEDIIVDQSKRGTGLGKEIVSRLVALARQEQICLIHLTSNPTRLAARKLYESLGFVLKDTGVFQKVL